MRAARAVADYLSRTARSDVYIFVVWMPMVPGDDFRAATDEAKRLTDDRVRHYYDKKRMVGQAIAAELFPNAAQQMIESLSPDHELYDHLIVAAQRRGPRIAWDAALLYGADVAWRQRVPEPRAWTKQVSYLVGDADVDQHHTGFFYTGTFLAGPDQSDWFEQIALLLDSDLQ